MAQRPCHQQAVRRESLCRAPCLSSCACVEETLCRKANPAQPSKMSEVGMHRFRGKRGRRIHLAMSRKVSKRCSSQSGRGQCLSLGGRRMVCLSSRFRFSRSGPSRSIPSRGERWIRCLGSMPRRLASKAAWCSCDIQIPLFTEALPPSESSTICAPTSNWRTGNPDKANRH